jgi:hypothetical protein
LAGLNHQRGFFQDQEVSGFVTVYRKSRLWNQKATLTSSIITGVWGLKSVWREESDHASSGMKNNAHYQTWGE